MIEGDLVLVFGVRVVDRVRASPLLPSVEQSCQHYQDCRTKRVSTSAQDNRQPQEHAVLYYDVD